MLSSLTHTDILRQNILMVKYAGLLVSAVGSESAFVMREVALLSLLELIAVPLEFAEWLSSLLSAH
jgi:hypothetical protein